MSARVVVPLDVEIEDIGVYRRFVFRDASGTVYEDCIWCGDVPEFLRPSQPPHVIVEDNA